MTSLGKLSADDLAFSIKLALVCLSELKWFSARTGSVFVAGFCGSGLGGFDRTLYLTIMRLTSKVFCARGVLPLLF